MITRKSLTLTLSTGLCLILMTHALAENGAGTLEGFTVDPQGNHIPNLHVILENTQRGDVTDRGGYFVIENIPPGKYAILLDHISYEPRRIDGIEIRADQVINLGTLSLELRVIEMDGIVVTATRTSRKNIDVSQPINIIPQARIVERNAKTSAEALREEVGLFIQKTSHGGGSAIIRGLSSNQILLMVDGIRLNNSTYRLGNHQYLTTIDIGMLDRLEVVRGPTSMLYGSDALGGTINAVTRKPGLSISGQRLNYRLQSRYASADQEKTVTGDLSYQNRRVALQVGFGYKDYDDLRRGANSSHPEIENATNGLLQNPTGFSAYDVNAKTVIGLTPQQVLILAYQMSRKIDVPRYDKYENNGYYRWIYTPQSRDMIYTVYEYKKPTTFISSLRATLSYHRQEEGREKQKTSGDPLTRENDCVGTTGFSLQMNSPVGKSDLTVGFDLYSDRADSDRFFVDTASGDAEKDTRGRHPDGAVYRSLGVFLQDELHLSRRWAVTSGVRYSHFSTQFSLPADSETNGALDQIDQNFASLTGSFGLLCKVTESVVLNANIGQAFRAPNLSDLSKLGESKGETYEVPNPDLEPEKLLSVDAGFKIDSRRLQASFSAYYARITDLLASAETTYNGLPDIEINGTTYQVKSKQNIGNAYIRGVEAFFRWNLYDNLFLRVNATSTFGQNTTADEPVGGIPPAFGLTGIEWRRERSFIEGYLRFATKQDRLSADDLDDPRIPEGGTPAWTTLNIRCGFRLWMVSFQCAVENILDVNYREHGSGVNGPGRNVIVSMILNN